MQRQHASNNLTTLTNPGKTSVQVVWPKNPPDSQITVTRATLEPGATWDRRTHPVEATWIVEQGSALVLLVGNRNMRFAPGTSCGLHRERSTGSSTTAQFRLSICPLRHRLKT